MSSVIVTLDGYRFEMSGQPLCPRCQARLELHQPDLGFPDRLLGTCSECRGWYLIDLVTEQMLLLPDGVRVAVR